MHIPKSALMSAMDGVLPSEFQTVVFAQWSEDKDALLVGFSEGVMPEEIVIPAELN